MRNFYITTDSNSDLPNEYLKKFNTTIIPQYYSFDGVIYGDKKNLSPKEFYARMTDGELPGSLANNPDVVEKKFRAILDKGCDIIHISFSSALSGSYGVVSSVAKDLLKEYPEAKISVIDSLNVCLNESIMLIHAENLKARNFTYEEIVADLESFKKHLNVQFTVDDLYHLQRGGRVSKTTAVVGSALNLKPFLQLSKEGTLVSCGTIRGREKSLRTLVLRMKDTLDDTVDYTLPVGIAHASCLKEAEFLADLIKKETPFTTVMINDLSPSIGVHTGSGAIGVLYYGKEKPAAAEFAM